MRHINEILQDVMSDLFTKTRAEARADSIEAMNRELPKICAMLDLDQQTLKPVENVRKRA